MLVENILKCRPAYRLPNKVIHYCQFHQNKGTIIYYYICILGV